MDYKEQLTDMVKTLIAQDHEGARAIAQQIVVAKSQSFLNGGADVADAAGRVEPTLDAE